ncbi:hypothetical protein SM98_00354 [Klebsiella pneumoniae]|nr:DUF551 domain-containing protein [Klebsiella pneumoniae]KMI83468.1 hypothetical protein SM98_00354 [Klebsiella pneumoniae]
MTKSTITREQLIKKAQEQIEFCRHTKITGEGRAHVNQCAALFEIALAAMDSEPHTDDELSNLLWYSQEATCHSDQNYYCEFQRLATPGLIAGIIRELQERRNAAMDSKPVAYISKSDFDAGYPHILARRDFNKACTMAVYAAQPAPVVPDEIKHRIGGLDWGWEGEFNRGWNACRAAMLAAAPQSPGSEPATVPGKWIPVSERMPDENADQQVLACFKGGDISTLYYFEGRWDDAYGIVPIRQDVTHWMPLPAAPQEAQGE